MTEDELKIQAEAVAYAKAHKRVRCAALTDPKIYPPEENPVSVFMAGSPGAGKTEAAKEIIAQLEAAPDAPKVLRIDPDDLRSEFPGYKGSNSWLFQRATSIWVDKIHDLALGQRQTFLLDGTLSNYERAKRNVERSLGRDRRVNIWYVYQSPYLAWEFVQAREAEEGRNIPPERFIDQYFAARDVVNTLKREFGPKIQVDLLLKPNDDAAKLVRVGIDTIDTHVPERFTRAELEAALGVKKG
ncbi:MAG TPA: zeta toxin family protein [Steroidobacteraceae bacterium]|nr:zeta toxin family protein [Steroidobacteraceae bacterium]